MLLFINNFVFVRETNLLNKITSTENLEYSSRVSWEILVLFRYVFDSGI